MSYCVEVIVMELIKPGKRILATTRELFLGGQCVDCKRSPGEKNTQTTFRGMRRNGLCPRCNSRQLNARLSLGGSAAAEARYESKLIRRGKYVTKKLAKWFRENTFRQAAAESRRVS